MRISDWSSDVCSSDLLLLYANVSKGYKAGSFPGVSAGTFAQYAAVTRESLVDYEAGFKTTLFDRKVTLNGGVFYYDYKNKQLRAKIGRATCRERVCQDV